MSAPARRRANLEPGWVPLLEDILKDRPNLPDAACLGKHDLFDAARFPIPGTTGAEAHAAATNLCRRCPARSRCPDDLSQKRELQ